MRVHQFTGTQTGDVTGTLLDCGTGRTDEIPPALAGNVALLHSGGDLGAALGNVKRAGASAVIFANGEPRFFYANVNPPNVIAPTASIGSDDVSRLKPDETVRVVSAFGDARFSWGTSFASPHVAGVAALLLGLAPGTPPAEIRTVLAASARDAGAPGRDDLYGAGLVDAWAAAQILAPEKLPVPSRRRAAAH